MSWELVGAIVGWGIALYAFFAVVKFFDNNAENWRRLDRIERMLRELTGKDVDGDKPEK